MKNSMRWALVGSVFSMACGGVGDEGAVELDSQQAPLLYGSADFTSYPHEGAAHVGVFTPAGGKCSGVLLRNNVVLTARHCATTDGTLNGAITSTPSAMRARVGGSAASSCSVYAPGMCQAVTTIVPAPLTANGSNNQDAALLILAGPITVNGDSKNFFSAIDPFPASNYLNEWALVTGGGKDELGNDGTPKQGTQIITNTNNVATIAGTSTGFRQLTAQDPATPGTANAEGDSGASLWSIGSARPSTIIGVHSTGGRSQFAAGNFARAEDFRYQFDKYLSDNYAPTKYYLTLSNLALFEQVQTGSSSTPVWQATGGTFVQKANARGQLLYQGAIYQNVSAGIEVSATDDDDVGVIARYTDVNNFMYCTANRAKHYLRIVTRVNGSENVVGSVSWRGSLSTRKPITLFASNSYVSCNLNGEASVEGYQYELVAGRVGIYNNYNQGAVYYSFGFGPEAVSNTSW